LVPKFVPLFGGEHLARKSSDKTDLKNKVPFTGDISKIDDVIAHLRDNNPLQRKSSDAKEEVRRISFSIERSNIDDVVSYLRNESTIPLSTPNTSDKNLFKFTRKYSESYDLPQHHFKNTNDDDSTLESLSDPLAGYHQKYYTELQEYEDYLMFGTEKLKKPFVEKPIDAEDHNINIYYPNSDGGGCKRLFRKTHDISSDFEANCNSIRKDGSYIYEEFLLTEGVDI
jgi:hypothetical protein